MFGEYIKYLCVMGAGEGVNPPISAAPMPTAARRDGRAGACCSRGTRGIAELNFILPNRVRNALSRAAGAQP